MTTVERTPLVDELLAKVEEIRPVIERNRDWNEEHRRLADEVYDAMINAGLFRMTAPNAFGGFEMHPSDIMRVYFSVAKIDIAAGWNLNIGASGAHTLATFPAAGGEEIYATGPDLIAAGSLNPPAKATRVEGGWRVSGRLPFASGCQRAAWLGALCIATNESGVERDPTTGRPLLLFVFMPRSEARVIETWNTMGMRGTGSHDIEFDSVFVPHLRVRIESKETAPAFAGPLYRTPGFVIIGQAVPVLAAAERAADELVSLAATKVPGLSRSKLAEHETAQHHMGKARTFIEAAKSFMYDTLNDGYDHAAAGEPASLALEKRAQMAARFLAEAGTTAMDLVFEAAGTTGFMQSHGFERCFRDVHSLAQHTGHAPGRYASVGKVEFGIRSDTPALSALHAE
ncbi:MAG: acyl-CoA dehydrogenase family protein [Dehalococcoidia bacterium]